MIRINSGHFKQVAFMASFFAVTQPLSAQALGARFRIEVEWRIRAEDHELSHLSQIFVGPHDVTVVPVMNENRLALFDSSERRTGSVGGKGAGPGEFNSVQGLAVGWKQDTLWAHDTWQRRISYFGPNAKLLRTVAEIRVDRLTLSDRRKSGLGVGSYGIMAIAGDGTIFAC